MKPYYQDSHCTIYHGDCREILPTLPKVDLVLADPPYGIGENRRKQLSRGNKVGFRNKGKRLGGSFVAARDYGPNDWDKKPPTQATIRKVLAAADTAIIWGGNYFLLPPRRGWLVWDKLNSGDFADCELAWTNLETAVRKFDLMWNGMLRGGEARGVPRVHPTQKPVELMTWCIGIAKSPQTILDPFMGSGTTLRAAKDLGRKSIGIELEEKYCEIAAKRLQQECLPLVVQAQPEVTHRELFEQMEAGK